MKMDALERNCRDLQADLDTAREYIVALMEASYVLPDLLLFSPLT